MKNFTIHCIAAISIGVLLLSGCARKSAVRPPMAAAVPGTIEVGKASWYGRPYHGRRAASGEIYDMEKMTAAHRTLPFGTRVRVDNLGNGKRVDLRINDRGPFVNSRVIDVSHAAARALGMLGPGTARVRIEVLSAPAEPRSGFFAVQVGAFQDRVRAERLRGEMEKRYGPAKIVEREGNPALWRVLTGKLSSMESADALAQRIRSENPDRAGTAFVVRLD